MMRVASVLVVSIGPPRAISVRKLVEFLRIYEEGKSKKMKKEEAMTKYINLSDSLSRVTSIILRKCFTISENSKTMRQNTLENFTTKMAI